MRIAIDGPAASGKTSVGLSFAKKLNLLFLDTGIMYRAATVAVLRSKLDPLDEKNISDLINNIKIEVKQSSFRNGSLDSIFLDGENISQKIRDPEVNENVSQISIYSAVRKKLTDIQRKIAEPGNIVMAGRDIGTVVLPDAEVKIFLQASLEERAKRRYNEEKNQNRQLEYFEIIKNLIQRDQIDSEREIAPLTIAKDAFIINTNEKSEDDVVREILEIVKNKKL